MRKQLLEQNLNVLWASLIIDQCVKNGSKVFFVSPGNRCAPFISALSYNDFAIKKSCFDERAGAYQALGYAKATGLAGIVICTSGTALANYYPAVLEAFKDELPLIVISADRPPELSYSDANQTMNQKNFYSEFVTKSLNLPCPTEEFLPNMLCSQINYALSKTTAFLKGPIHINCAFRDPLIPIDKSISTSYKKSAQKIFHSKTPYTCYKNHHTVLFSKKEILPPIRNAKRGLVVVGAMHPFEKKQDIIKFLSTLSCPVFVDIASSLKWEIASEHMFFSIDTPEIIKEIEVYNPDVIVHLGKRLTSKYFYTSLLKNISCPYILVNESHHHHDPAHRVNTKYTISPENFVKHLEIKSAREEKKKFLISSRNLYNQVNKDSNYFQEIIKAVQRNIPENEGLFLGNSSTIRAFDHFLPEIRKKIPTAVNRGISGIEGHIATAIGFSLGLSKRVTAVMGDISFLHDINSLALLEKNEFPLIIVVRNNHGGKIFEKLPVRHFPEIISPLMNTPHNWNFCSIAKQFHIPYKEIKIKEDFEKVYRKCLSENKNFLLEVGE